MAKNTIKSVKMAFNIVGSIQRMGGATLTELAEELDTSTSTMYNYLKTLEEEEYIVNDDGTYYVGLKFLTHGAHARNRRKLFDVAVPEVNKLAEQTGELANLLVEEHGRGVLLHRAFGAEAVHVKAQTGDRVPLHCGAHGKAILAHLPDERRQEIFDKHGLPAQTPATITDRDELVDHLAEVKERGYAFDNEEMTKGLRCVAVPVLSDAGQILGSISVSGPTHRFRGEHFREELPTKLLEVVNVIELNVTHS